MPVRPDGEMVEARFVDRPNRFVVVAETRDGTVRAHCPNPGRLGEFLHEGTPYLLRRRPDASPDQATTHSVVAAVDGRFHVDSDLELGQAPPGQTPSVDEGAWVVLDTQMANRLVDDALTRGVLDDAFPGRAGHRAEPAARGGRFDFEIETDEGPVMLEVKSVTLIGTDGETALFPDAPTERGTRHLRELTERAREGQPAAVLFVAMREDAERVAPNTPMDPDFADALATARTAGVSVTAHRVEVRPSELELGERIPVVLDPGDAATGVSSPGEPVDREP